MPSLIHRALELAWRARFFVPAIIVAALAAPFTHPAVLVPLLLAQPLFLAGAVCALGYHLESDFAVLALRRGSVALVLIVAYTGWVALLAGAPLLGLVRSGTPEMALLLSVGFLAAAATLWRLWPTFGLVLLWDDAYPATGEGSWMLVAIHRCTQFAHHLTIERDPYFGRGLPLTLLLMVTVSAALSIAGLCGLLPSELKLSALALFALVLCPLTYTLIAWRTERLLMADAAEHDALEGAPSAAASAGAPPSADPVELRAQLLLAAGSNQVERALALLEHGADANAQPLREERDQRSLAIIAATMPDLRLLRAAIARGCDVNRAVGDLTPLLAATRDSYQGRPDAVLTLLANGADPRAADAQGNTPLHHAVLACEPSVAAILLDADAPLEVLNRDSMSPLAAACAAGNLGAAKLLLDRGALANPTHGVAALTAAASAAREAPDLVKLLVKQRAQVNAHDKLGRTALHAAALHGHADTVDALLAAGAQLNARDALGVTALIEAARGGHNRVLQRLVFKKPEPDHCDHGGRTALVIACQSRQANEETVRLLLAMHCDTELATAEGRRALDYAVAAGRWPVVALLDPSYPLPSSLRGGEIARDAASAGLDRVELLGQALRHARAELAAELLALEPALGSDELARAFLAAAGEASRGALEGLMRAGLEPEQRDVEGQPLLAVLAPRRPLPLAAVELLLEAGAAVGGAIGPALIEGLVDERLALGAEHAEVIALALLARGADPFRADARGRTLAHLASARGQRGLLSDLLARGVDPNAADARGRTPLFELAGLPEAVSLPLARLLLAAGADPERRGGDGQTPLGAALAAGRGELARWLTAQVWRYPGRRLLAADLPAAASAGDAAAVARLLELDISIDARDAHGASALLRACGAGHRDLAAWLIDAGADATLVAATGASCLSAAVSAGHVAIVELLLARGVAPDAPLPGGATALMVAAALGAVPAAQKLIAHGARLTARDEQGQTALHAAAQFAFSSAEPEPAKRLLELLLDAGAELDAASASAQTPLLLLLGARAAAGRPSPQRGLSELTEMMLARGADLDAQDQRGVGVLHAAAMHGLAEPCRVLLRAGANPGLRDALGRNAAEVALMLGYADLAAEVKRVLTREKGGLARVR